MGKPKILVVDDHVGVSQFFAEFINDPIFEVQVVHTSKEAAKILQNQAPDMVIADIGKLEDRSVLAKAINLTETVPIWASRFEDIDFKDLPLAARILNKPFKTVDIRYAVRAEFAKTKKRFDTL